jgi:hypothetical protein
MIHEWERARIRTVCVQCKRPVYENEPKLILVDTYNGYVYKNHCCKECGLMMIRKEVEE